MFADIIAYIPAHLQGKNAKLHILSAFFRFLAAVLAVFAARGR